MNITRLSIQRPLTILMLVAGLVIMGMVAFTLLPVRRLPNVQFPFVMVTVSYPGASPEDMRTLVTDPIENAVQGVSGIETITGISAEGLSRVALRFTADADENVAANDVSQAVNRIAGSLPTGATAPTIIKADPNAIPVMDIALGGRLTPAQLYTLANDLIQPALSAVPGVASVDVIGGQVPEVNVQVHRRLLAAYHLPLPAVVDAVASQNVSLPGGELQAGSAAATSRTRGYFESLQGLENLPVGGGGTATIPLRDVADVESGYAPVTTIHRLNGRPAVGLTVTVQSGANSIEVDNAVRQKLASLKHELPQGLSLRITGDTTSYTRSSMTAVETDLLLAILLTGAVLLVFLHRFRNTLIVLLAIPSSLITTFLVMYFLHFSLDTVSLIALSLLIGILVDDSIVVLENINRHLRVLGEDPPTAAYNGRMEIGGAALAITLTDVVVYAPMAFVSGMVGQIFHEFGLTIVAATLISLFISFTLTPMLASRWLHPVNGTGVGAFGRAWERFFDRLVDLYERLLRAALRHRPTILFLGLLALAGSISFIPLGLIGTGFVPAGDPGVFNVTAQLPPGTSLAGTDRVLNDLSRNIRRIPGVVDVAASVGAGGGFQGLPSENVGQLTVDLTPKDRRAIGIQSIIARVRQLAAAVPGLKVTTSIPSAFFSGGEAGISVILQGPDLHQLDLLGNELEARLRRLPELREVTSTSTPAEPEWAIRLNRSALAYYGLSARTVAQAVQTAVGGTVASEYRASYLPKEEDILVSVAGANSLNAAQMSSIPVGQVAGQLIDLGQVATVERTLGPVQIDEQNQELEVQVNASPARGESLGLATRAVQGVLAKFPLPPGYGFTFGGLVYEQNQAFAPLIQAFALSILLIYMLMAALYESLLYPLAIILSLPLATVGAFLGLLVTHNEFDMFSFIALIVLMGLVSKNAILLIDRTIALRSQGEDLTNALVQAARVRLRPILMTTSTMVLAMLPIALKIGAGSSERAPMGTVLIGGLITSTLLTLVVVPVLYTYLDALGRRIRRPRPRAAPGPATAGPRPLTTHRP